MEIKTIEQLQRAAVKLCEIRGIDPEVGPGVIVGPGRDCNWQLAAIEIMTACELNQAIAECTPIQSDPRFRQVIDEIVYIINCKREAMRFRGILDSNATIDEVLHFIEDTFLGMTKLSKPKENGNETSTNC